MVEITVEHCETTVRKYKKAYFSVHNQHCSSQSVSVAVLLSNAGSLKFFKNVSKKSQNIPHL